MGTVRRPASWSNAWWASASAAGVAAVVCMPSTCQEMRFGVQTDVLRARPTGSALNAHLWRQARAVAEPLHGQSAARGRPAGRPLATAHDPRAQAPPAGRATYRP